MSEPKQSYHLIDLTDLSGDARPSKGPGPSACAARAQPHIYEMRLNPDRPRKGEDGLMAWFDIKVGTFLRLHDCRLIRAGGQYRVSPPPTGPSPNGKRRIWFSRGPDRSLFTQRVVKLFRSMKEEADRVSSQADD